MSVTTVFISLGLLLICSGFVRILMIIHRHLTLRKKLKSIPGPKTLPFIGLSRELRKIPTDELYQWTTDLLFQYKDGIVVTWLGTQPAVHIRKPQQIEVIMRSRTLIRKAEIYNFLAYWLGNGLLTSSGDVWHQNRRLITPAFHFNILDNFNEIIYEKTVILNEIIESKVKKDPNKPINIFPLSIKYTLDTVNKTVMGVDMDIQRQPENEYVKALHRFAILTIYRYVRLVYRSDFLFYLTSKGQEYKKSIKTLHDFTNKVIQEKNEFRKQQKVRQEEVKDSDTGKKNVAFLDLLMDLSEKDENPLTPEQIREQVDTFMFGGHDTTGIAMSYALFCLGTAPEIQKKVQEEIDDVLSGNEVPTKQQLNQLKLLDCVIKESLRLFPSAPNVSRSLDHDVTIDNYDIPKGVIVVMQILHLHRDPDVWEDPLKFDPDRFLPENNHRRHPYAYVPFSAGPRNCIGQKFAHLMMKICLASIMKKWTVVSDKKISEMKLKAQIVLTPPDETINLLFKPRVSY